MSAANVLMCDQLRRCKTAHVITATDGERICSSCHRRRETTRKKPRRKTVRQVQPAPRRTHASPTARPAVADHLPRQSVGSHRSDPPRPSTVPCTTCDRGEISVARWSEGKRQCTRCAPLRLVAVGVHKSIPTILLAEDVTPATVASGRRRP